MPRAAGFLEKTRRGNKIAGRRGRKLRRARERAALAKEAKGVEKAQDAKLEVDPGHGTDISEAGRRFPEKASLYCTATRQRTVIAMLSARKREMLLRTASHERIKVMNQLLSSVIRQMRIAKQLVVQATVAHG